MTAPTSPRSRADVNRANSQHSTGPASTANTTEEILVDELAQSFWRTRRFRELEARAWSPELLSASIDNGMLTLIARSVASAERSFHKSLAALQKPQRIRGFVPPKTAF